MAPPELPLHFAVAGEDEAHHLAVTTLTHRVLTTQIPWLDGVLKDCLVWRPWSVLMRAAKEARARDLRRSIPTGNFGRGQSGSSARMALHQLRLWKDSHDHGEPIDAAFLARDLDHKDRLEGLREAIDRYPWSFVVVLAWFQPEVEAWFIAGCRPGSGAHTRLKSQLGFCPIEQPHLLSSTHDASVKDAKAVWQALSANDRTDRSRSLEDADLAVLRRNGADAGLAAFLDQLHSHVVPLFTARSR